MDYTNCRLCPRECGVNRAAGETGFCGCPAAALVAKTMRHMWEEPVLAGSGGSGALFFGGCTLGCKYCQNAAISGGPVGKPTDSAGLRRIFEDLIAQGAENIDLVTPTHFLPTILPALEPRLPVPVVCNCGGYERVETLRELEGKIDIYLPDFKYADGALAADLSGAGLFPPGSGRHPGNGATDRRASVAGGQAPPWHGNPSSDSPRTCGQLSAGAGLDWGDLRLRTSAGQPYAPVHPHGEPSRPL